MRHLGLRVRVSAAFAVGALFVSTSMALLSHQLTEQFLLNERERVARRSVDFDARLVSAGLEANPEDIAGVLGALDTGGNRRAFVRRDGRWYSAKVDNNRTTDSIPEDLMRMVAGGQAAIQRVEVAGVPAMVIGIPLDPRTALYEVDSMRELDRSLKVLGLVLTLVAASTAVAGAVVGWYAARRVLRPLSTVANAARDIAAGHFSARLDPGAEPELEHLTTSFNQMVDELSRRMERDRRFAADVSHELRSPLQTLAAAASVLERRRQHLDERTATAATLLANEVTRFQELVTDLLELARSDQPADRKPVDMAALSRQACRARELAPDVVRVMPGAQTVWQVDRRRFEQVLANLLDNAQSHGGGVLRVRLGQEPGLHYLEVDDEGPGIGVQDRDAIFDRFVRGRSANARGDSEGSGLGLALVAQHVAAHCGRVSVTDRPGGGARFRVDIPVEGR